ncbi:MAG TPA: hypothetical protein DCL74_04480 [Succinivibrionaceae bacterium]|nr:hypothetical protein [Succinivibrionaceae bacterium]
MEIRYSNTETRMYYHKVVGKVFKILPISEDFPETVNHYIYDLIGELHGSLGMLSKKSDKVCLMSVINYLNHLIETDCSAGDLKSTVFECIRLVKILAGEDT